MHMASQGESPYTYHLRDLYEKPKDMKDEEDMLNINVRDRNFCTPLHWAVYVSSQISISYLLANPEIQINARDIWGQTPLHKAVRKGELRVIKQLIVKGADKDIKDQQDRTPMQLAIEQFDTDDEDDVYTLKAIKELFKPDGIMTELAMLRTPN